MTSPSKVLLLQHKAEPEDRIIHATGRWTHLPAAILCARVISRLTADPLILPDAPDDDFLTLKLRFGKNTYSFPRRTQSRR
ncbi:MAG: hypothetical protein WCA06_04380 [Terrimicrobiaceae bacterium]